ncbi:MAG: portal protein [Candidatus Anstonellales archaeon]
MEKINLPLIGKISSMISRLAPAPKKREETTETSTYVGVVSYYYQKTKLERTRLAKYGDYEEMDETYPEISSSLDLYADNATKERGQTGEVIEIKTDDPKVRNVLDELITRLRLNDTLWDTARNMAKMGDDFDEVVCDESGDVIRLKNLPPNTIYVNVDEYGRKKEKPYVQKDETGSTDVAEFEDWQIIHWKNGGMKKMYGESVMKSIRRVYKQLQMMEDGMVIARLTRSHMRYKILVDVEGMTAEEREDYLKKIKNEFKKKRLINPLTGQLDTTQNPLSAEEDFFLAVTKDSRADVDVLQGATNLGNIRDVEYFQTKLFAGLKVPRAFVGLEKEVKAKATIVEEDIQFARTVGRIRKGLRIGLKKLFDYQLMVRGIAPINGLYEIHFAPISMVDEMRKWTIEKVKAEVAKIYMIDMGLLTDEFILKHFVGLDDEDIANLKGEKVTGGSAGAGGGRKSRVTSIRPAEMSGLVTPKFSGMSTKVEGGNGLDRDNLHIATLHMMNLVETLRDLVDLELNR